MDVQFQKKSSNFLDTVLSEVRNTEQTLEIRLGDGMPDIGRVLTSWGQPILRSKEWRNDSIVVSGGMMLWVLYAPEDGTQPRCVEGWLPFQLDWDLPEAVPEGEIRLHMLLRSADARSVSARKLMLRAGVGILAQAFVPAQKDVWEPMDKPEDVQLLRTCYPVQLLKEAGEKQFLLDEDLTLPGSAPQADKLICYAMMPQPVDTKVLGDKIVFRGNGNLHVLYRSEEGQLHSWDFPMPFSQYAELSQGYSTGAKAEVSICVTNLELTLDDEGHLRLKCSLTGQFLVEEQELLEIIEDAYSPVRDLTKQIQDLEQPVILETRQENMYAEQMIQADANMVVDVRFLPDFPRQYRADAQIKMQPSGMFQILYYSQNGSLQAAASRWEGDLTLQADPQSHLWVIPQCVSEAQFALSEGAVTLKTQCPIQLISSVRQQFPMVVQVELGQEREPDPGRPSLILHRVSESGLWNIAKENGSTVDAIRKANHLQEEPSPGQLLLIPVP